MKLYQRRSIAAKNEVAQGTNASASIGVTDYLRCPDFTVTPNIEYLPSNVMQSNLGSPAGVAGQKYNDVTAKLYLSGSGVAGTPLYPLKALWEACGATGSVASGTSVAYTLVSDPANASFTSPGRSCSILTFYDGVKHSIPGFVGSWKLTAAAGKRAELDFTGKGVYVGPLDASNPSGTPNTTIEPIVQSIQLSVLGYAMMADKVELDLGNKVDMIQDVNSQDGMYGFTITERNVVGSVDAYMVPVSTHDFWGKNEQGVQGAITFTIGLSNGNKYAFSIPNAQYSKVAYRNAGGLLGVSVAFKANETTNDAVSWTQS
jgi:hypothetical protein